jgi:5'-nucleotidase
MAKKWQILLTNDDGFQSPGLWAAAEALSPLGFVHVVAPRDQYSGAGRSLPSTSEKTTQSQEIFMLGKTWTVYSVAGSPAQAVMYAIYEILSEKPDLVVSGINYGENLGTGITVSGTVGAALEAAGNGIPAIAVSLETDPAYHLSYSKDIDFFPAACLTHFFAQQLLENPLPFDVDVLKVEVPASATCDTPWEMTRLSRQNYYVPSIIEGSSRKRIEGYRVGAIPEQDPPDTDIYVVRSKRHVAVTPISLDLTSRVTLDDLERRLRSG